MIAQNHKLLRDCAVGFILCGNTLDELRLTSITADKIDTILSFLPKPTQRPHRTRYYLRNDVTNVVMRSLTQPLKVTFIRLK